MFRKPYRRVPIGEAIDDKIEAAFVRLEELVIFEFHSEQIRKECEESSGGFVLVVPHNILKKKGAEAVTGLGAFKADQQKAA